MTVEDIKSLITVYRSVSTLRVEEFENRNEVFLSEVSCGGQKKKAKVDLNIFAEMLYFPDRKLEEELMTRLNSPVRGGLVLLLGRLGSGKSTFIRFFSKKLESEGVKNFIVDFRSANDFDPGFNLKVSNDAEERAFRLAISKVMAKNALGRLTTDELIILAIELVTADVLRDFKVLIPLEKHRRLEALLSKYFYVTKLSEFESNELSENSTLVKVETAKLRQYLAQLLSEHFKPSQVGQLISRALSKRSAGRVIYWFDNTDRLPPRAFRALLHFLSRTEVDMPKNVRIIISAREESLALATSNIEETDEVGRSISGGDLDLIYVAPSSNAKLHSFMVEGYTPSEDDFEEKFKKVLSNYYHWANKECGFDVAQEPDAAILNDFQRLVRSKIWGRFKNYLNYSIRDGLLEDGKFCEFFIKDFVKFELNQVKGITNIFDTAQRLTREKRKAQNFFEQHYLLTPFLAYASAGMARLDPLLVATNELPQVALMNEFRKVGRRISKEVEKLTLKKAAIGNEEITESEEIEEVNIEVNAAFAKFKAVIRNKGRALIQEAIDEKIPHRSFLRLAILLRMDKLKSSKDCLYESELSDLKRFVHDIYNRAALISEIKALGRLAGKGEGVHEFVFYNLKSPEEIECASLSPRGAFYIKELSAKYAYALVSGLKFLSYSKDELKERISNYVGAEEQERIGAFYAGFYFFVLGSLWLMLNKEAAEPTSAHDNILNHIKGQMNGVSAYLESFGEDFKEAAKYLDDTWLANSSTNDKLLGWCSFWEEKFDKWASIVGDASRE